MKNTALETTNFDFYGDELIAVQDNATGEIYTSINAVLKGIGFKDRDQIRKRRDKWINDSLISKGIAKFTLPTQKMVTKNDSRFAIGVFVWWEMSAIKVLILSFSCAIF